MAIPEKSKGDLSWAEESRTRPKYSRRTLTTVFFAGLLFLYPLSYAVLRHHKTSSPSYELKVTDVCPQVEPLAPSSEANRKLAEELSSAFSDPSFEAEAAEYLGAAVRIP